MPKTPKRACTDAEKLEIQDLWSEYQSLRRLVKKSLVEGAVGSWIAESAANRQREIIARLDEIFQETAP